MTSKYDPAKALKAILVEELHLNPMEFPIHIWVENNSIGVEGVVEKVSQKKKAVLFAMGLEGVTGVIDRLTVKPCNHMSDAEIQSHLLNAISGDSALQGSKISVEVRDGVVDIEGTVISLSHKRMAGVFAWWVPGSLDVINSLEITPPEEDNDDEVSDALRLILEKDRLVDASSLKVHTHNWVVTLEGVAGSDAEREAAEDDAWYTWGVNWVNNRIIVDKTSVHKLP